MASRFSFNKKIFHSSFRSDKISKISATNMFPVASLICFLAAACTVIDASNIDKTYNNQSEVINDMIDNMFTCMQELQINPDVCSELLMKDKNREDKQYDNCKCFGSCVSKKIGTMDVETGKWNWARIKEFSALMENDVLQKEANIIYTSCFDETNVHCVASYALMKCVLEHSPMAQDMAKSYMTTKEKTGKDAFADEEV